MSFSRPSVQVSIGKKLAHLEENEQKIFDLQNIIKSQAEEINRLKLGAGPFIKEINGLKRMNEKLTKDNKLLSEKLQTFEEIRDRINAKNIEESQAKFELMDGNKKLQQKVEILTKQLENMRFEVSKQKEEYNNMCRVKESYESEIINLTDALQKCEVKLKSSEDVIRKKEKYIQMLIGNSSNYEITVKPVLGSTISSTLSKNKSTGRFNGNKHRNRETYCGEW